MAKEDNRAIDEAARWFSKNCAGLSASQRTELLAWLRAAPENVAALDLVAAAWDESASAAAKATQPQVGRDGIRQTAVPGNPRRSGATRTSALIWGVGALGCLAVCVIGWRAATVDVTYRTDRGETLAVSLADGSRLQLDAATSIRIHFDPLERRAQMSGGEAEFQIAHESRRQFRVEARSVEVRDLGTRFTIRDRTGPLRVVLIEGSADVLDTHAGGNSRVALQPGQQAVTTAAGIVVAEADMYSALSWQEGRIVFNDVTLVDALAEWTARVPVAINLTDRGLHTLRISGVYRTTDMVSFLNALCRVHPLRWRQIVPGRYEVTPTPSQESQRR